MQFEMPSPSPLQGRQLVCLEEEDRGSRHVFGACPGEEPQGVRRAIAPRQACQAAQRRGTCPVFWAARPQQVACVHVQRLQPRQACMMTHLSFWFRVIGERMTH